jgi:tRNA threonylcarbamoyladenosine biosynthesis protein TsaB
MMARLNSRAFMDPCLLALDSSTDALALALLTAQGRWHLNEAGGSAASARIVPAAQALLAQAGTSLASLDAIAFAAGPGAFTGLRTACAVAQGLAFGAGKPVLALDSLMIVAEDAWGLQAAAPGLHWVAVDARMDEVYAAAYTRPSSGGWEAAIAPALYTLRALADTWQRDPPAASAGNALSVFRGRLPDNGAPGVPGSTDRAAALGRVAAQAWRSGGAIDPAAALPLYLRDKVAQTTEERARQRAMQG